MPARTTQEAFGVRIDTGIADGTTATWSGAFNAATGVNVGVNTPFRIRFAIGQNTAAAAATTLYQRLRWLTHGGFPNRRPD